MINWLAAASTDTQGYVSSRAAPGPCYDGYDGNAAEKR